MGKSAATRADVETIRKQKYADSEVGQALWEELNQLRGQVMMLQRKLDYLGRIKRVVVSTDNGQTGVTRTYNIPMAVAKTTVVALSCGTGGAYVKAATCAGGVVTVTFDVDPGTTQKISIWIAAPDKYLVG